MTTLWVQGNDDYNAGRANGRAGGLQRRHHHPGLGQRLLGRACLAAPAGFVNLAGGHVAVYGGGGPAALTGTLTNDGYLSLSGVGAMSIDTLVNNGTVGVDATGLSVPGADGPGGADRRGGGRLGGGRRPPAATPRPPAGGGRGARTRSRALTVGSGPITASSASIPAPSWRSPPTAPAATPSRRPAAWSPPTAPMIVDGGLFHFTGGGLWGTFTVRDGPIRVGSGVVAPSTVDVVGDSTLLDNASSAVTLDVQGGSPLGDGDAVLTAADGATNFGAIVLESLDGVHHGYFRVPEGSFTNEAGRR